MSVLHSRQAALPFDTDIVAEQECAPGNLAGVAGAVRMRKKLVNRGKPGSSS